MDKYFRLGRNLNQRDTIAVRRMVDGYVKLLYPNGEFAKEDIEEILRVALEMRRRVKEQLKKLGGMEFYDVNFSYIDNETFEEKLYPYRNKAVESLFRKYLQSWTDLFCCQRKIRNDWCIPLRVSDVARQWKI